jgi:hypothetical protein
MVDGSFVVSQYTAKTTTDHDEIVGIASYGQTITTGMVVLRK